MVPLEKAKVSKAEEDEILENEVMALDEGEEDEEGEDGMDMEEEDEDEDDDGMPFESDDEDDEEEEDEEDVGDRWGKRRRTYYNTDYVDSEIVSSDVEGPSLSSCSLL